MIQRGFIKPNKKSQNTFLKKLDENELDLICKSNKNFLLTALKLALPLYLEALITLVLREIGDLLVRLNQSGTNYVTIYKIFELYTWLSVVAAISRIGVFISIGILMGQQQYAKIPNVIALGIYINFSFVLIMISLLLMLKNNIYQWLYISSENYKTADKMIIITIVNLILWSLYTTSHAVLISLSYTRYILYINFFAEIISLTMLTIFVYGFEMALVSIFYARMIGYSISITILFTVIHKYLNLKKIFLLPWKIWKWKEVWHILKLSFPSAIEAITFNLIAFMILKYMSFYSVQTNEELLLRTSTALGKLSGISTVLATSLGSTTAILVGRLYGFQMYNRIYVIARKMLFVCLLSMLVSCLLMLIIMYPMLIVFKIPPQTILKYCFYLFLIDMITKLGVISNQIGLSSLQACKKVYLPLILGIISLLSVRLATLTVIFYTNNFYPFVFIIILYLIYAIDENTRGWGYFFILKLTFHKNWKNQQGIHLPRQ